MSKHHGSSKQTSQSDDVITRPGEDAAAFAATAAARAALKPEELVRINVDVGSAAAVAVGAAPRILTFADAIRGVSDIPEGVVDQFVPYAQAAAYANLVWLNVTSGADEVQQLHVEVGPIRTKLLAVLDLGVAFGIVDPGIVARIRVGSGYRDEAEDTTSAAAQIEEHWEHFDGKSPITKADLAHARERAGALSRAVALRDAGALPTVTAATSDRARAFTLLWRTYDQVRRAISHIRWSERDLDVIAPSLWNAPGNGRHTGSDVATPAQPSTPAQPAAVTAPAGAPAHVADPGPAGTPFTS